MKFGLKLLLVILCALAGLPRLAQAQDSTHKVDEVTPYIQSIADALGRDPVRIYEWVRNSVDFTPYYGFKRGAHLTALELQGNDFDTAALLVALLKACDKAGDTAVYHWGTVQVAYGSMEDDESGVVNACNWLAAERTMLKGILEKAGLEFTDPTWKIDDATDTAKIRVPHLWVIYTRDGIAYKLTPAFKSYRTRKPYALADNFASTLLTEAAGTLTNVAGTGSASAYTGNATGKNALRTRLGSYTKALVDQVAQTNPGLSGRDLAGGRSIRFAKLNALPTAFPSAFSNATSRWCSASVETKPAATRSPVIPLDYLTRFEFKIGGLTYAGNTVNLQGKKITLWFKNNAAELWLDDASLQTESDFDPATPAEVTLTYKYPKYPLEPVRTDEYVAVGIKNSAAPLDRTGKYVLSYSFGQVLGRLNERLRLQSDYVDRKFDGNGRQLMSENLYVMSLQYLNLLAEMNEIAASATGTRIHFLFHAGIAGQKEVPYVDLPNNLTTCWPVEPQLNEAADKALALKVGTAAGFWFSLLEHTTIEQMLTGEGVSTVRMIQKAVELGNPVYLAKSWSDYAGASGTAGVRAQLTNYPGTQTSAREIVLIEKGLRDGGTLLIPKNAAMTYNDYKGTGYMLVKPEEKEAAAGEDPQKSSSILMGISGGMAGGWFSSLGGGSMASVASTADYQINPNFLSTSPVFQSSFIQDPVDMTNGSFYHTVTDLALDGDSVHGLALSRRYSSARRTADPVGLGKGWSHSYNMQLGFRHPNDFSLARASVAEVAPFVIALKAITSIYNPEATAREGVVPALIACWLGDQLIDTRATVTAGEREMDFVKLPDGTYVPPPGVTATLVKVGSTHTLTFRKGSKLTFNSDGKCTRVSDYNNSTGTERYLGITYTSADKPNRVTDAYGRYLQFNYAGDGRLISVADSTGRTVSYANDKRDGLDAFVVTDPEGNSSRYYSDDQHRITKLVDGLGRTVVTSKYNTLDQITEQRMQGLDTRIGTMGFAPGVTRDTDPEGHTAWLYYDERGRTHTSVDPLGAISNTEFDGNDRVVRTIDALSRVNDFEYDSNHELVLIQDALDQIRLIRPESDDSVSWFRREFNFEGLETTTRYYNFHKPKSITAPGGITEEYEYDNRGRIIKHHPASFAPGQWISYAYTESGGYLKRVVATYPLQDGASAATTEIADFNALGDLIQFIDRRGKKSTFAYDANRRLLEEADWSGTYTAADAVGGVIPGGSLLRTLTYDANGDLASETQDAQVVSDVRLAMGDRTFTYEHDAEGRLLSVRGPDNKLQVTNIYETRGLLDASVDGLGHVTTFDYDAVRRPTKMTDEIYRTIETRYDLLGRPISTISPRMYETKTEYDMLDRVAKSIDPRNGPAHPIEYTYDNDGRQTKLKNRRAKDYTTAYADLLREVSTTTPLDAAAAPRSTRTVNNNRGLPVTITEPSGQVTTFETYDNEGRVLLLKDGAGIYTRFTYLPGGLLGTVREPVNPDGTSISGVTRTTSRTYDIFGRLLNYQDGEGGLLTHAYDFVGNLQGVGYPGGFTVAYAYDTYNRLTKVMEWTSPPSRGIGLPINGPPFHVFSPSPVRTTIYTYDELGRVASISRPNGTLRELTYDAAGQTVAIEESRTSGSSPAIWTRFFRYDEGGHDNIPSPPDNPTLTNDRYFFFNDGEITHTYSWPPPSSALHWSSVVTYAPPNDAVAYNDDNQLATFNGSAVVHDPDGNMTTGPLPVTGSVGAYGYDSRNRLISADGSTYRYNPDGFRVQTTGPTAATSATYLVDPVAGLSRVLARTSNGTTTRYVWGLGLLHEVEGSTVRYYHADQVGSTVAITNAVGEVTDRVDYAPFGEVVARMGSTGTPFLFNGETGVETDSNGLLFMRARYYHPRLMRFINADPLRFEGGMNWYAFAGNNPVGYLDPAGTERVAAAMAQSIVDYGMGEVQWHLANRRKMEERWESPAGQAARALVPFADAIAEYQLGDTDAALRSATLDVTFMAMGGVGKMASAGARGVGAGARAAENVAGMCFVAGTPIATADGSSAIDMIQVGDRVLTGNGTAHVTNVDLATWRKIVLRMSNPRHSMDAIDIELLRSPEWVSDLGCVEGGWIWLNLTEMGIHGWANVVTVAPCPPLKQGAGRVVLATVAHRNSHIVQVSLVGASDEIRSTQAHPFFSVTRNGWVSAGELQVGETLATSRGEVAVGSISEVPGAHRVYNIEVESDHTYYVGDAEVLVHNVCALGQLNQSEGAARAYLRRQLGPGAGQAHHLIPLEHRNHPLIKLAAKGGFEINGKGNGLRLSAMQHNGSHKKYNDAIAEVLDRKMKPSMTPAAAAKAVQDYADQLKKGLAGKTRKLK